MSFDNERHDSAIMARGLSKCYQLYANPRDRLKQMLWRGRRKYFREFWALRDVNFDVMPGEVIGIIGRNGAGKSTLLQLVCGTITPSEGEIMVRGRVAALLELGTGFNPDFSGRENVFLSASLLGLNYREIADRYEQIVDFSGVRNFIDQPVKTYSSGMYVRLAFAVATSVDPDVLVIDEALSVGDGEFARKSFDRIMDMRARGVTILFCSHSMYHVEAICGRVLWLRDGRVELIGDPASVVSSYNAYIDGPIAANQTKLFLGPTGMRQQGTGIARIKSVEIMADDRKGQVLFVKSQESDLSVRVAFASDPALPTPTIGIGILNASGLIVASFGSFLDRLEMVRDDKGDGEGELVLPALPLLKGGYKISVFLLCERGLYIYDYAERCATINVSQEGLEQGVVALPHYWETE